MSNFLLNIFPSIRPGKVSTFHFASKTFEVNKCSKVFLNKPAWDCSGRMSPLFLVERLASLSSYMILSILSISFNTRQWNVLSYKPHHLKKKKKTDFGLAFFQYCSHAQYIAHKLSIKAVKIQQFCLKLNVVSEMCFISVRCHFRVQQSQALIHQPKSYFDCIWLTWEWQLVEYSPDDQ